MSKVDKDELKLIFKEMKEGNENSFEVLYRKYYSTVYGVAFSILKNKENSEDIAHNVFMKLFRMDRNNLPDKGEASWLYIVTKNEVLQFLRGQKITVDIDDMYTIETENSEIEEFIDLTSYHKLIENLDPIDREIVSLRIISDFKFEKIAQMLDMPLGTVQWRYYKALHNIKLSITNLAVYVIVVSLVEVALWQAKENSESNKKKKKVKIDENTNTVVIEDKENPKTKSKEKEESKKSRNTSSLENVTFGEISTEVIMKDDFEPHETTVASVVQTIILVSMFVAALVFAVFVGRILLKDKIKIKRKKKK